MTEKREPAPADNIKVARIQLALEKAWAKNPNNRAAQMLQDIQSLIERILQDDKKIRQLEGMKGISWKEEEDERKTEEQSH